MHVDLNCDMGEIPEHIADGTQESLMHSITSVNIACGGHAGDERMMSTTIEQALRWNLAIGAHPGYPDRANFGRLELDLPLEAIETTVFEGLAGSPMLRVFRDAGFTAAAEAFADRRYEAGGTLRSRKFDDALIRDPRQAGEQALRIVNGEGVIASNQSIVPIAAQTICIHGDTPGAPLIAETVAKTLQDAGVNLRPLEISGR
jgi:UPF0271 protein